jgi:membrane protein insertase Oxa1/YidC/SpoIIIJ
MFVQQEMTTPPAMDERSASMNSTMLWMMPLMFTYFAISFPSGSPILWCQRRRHRPAIHTWAPAA